MVASSGNLSLVATARPENASSPALVVSTTDVGPAETDVMTVPEAATYLRMNVKTLYKLIDERRVPYVRITERRLRLRRSSLVAWLASQESDSRKASRR